MQKVWKTQKYVLKKQTTFFDIIMLIGVWLTTYKIFSFIKSN